MNRLLLFALILFTAGGCTQHLITDSDYRHNVHQRFEERRTQFTQGDLWRVFDTEMTTREREAMEFLYAYMSLADLADYEGDFFADHVRTALRSQEQTTWGKSIPESIFRHFVLPVRINNEALDSFRMNYYDELRRRVEGLSMYDAALEINHWCHEKVTYTPSDARTSSPEATVKRGRGRCGEESTLTVAAMRTVGIPARQVYTPRWAHIDDNHAWVEVWVDGHWYFLGACEPEPVLNLGWFNAPAARAMLMHTRVFGDYQGDEDIIQKNDCFTEINVIGNYVATRRSTVTVRDLSGRAVEGATVEFKLYNYAELYTVVRLQSDSEGRCSLTTGVGDAVVWASQGDQFGFTKLEGEQAEVVLNHTIGERLSVDLNLTPPAEGVIAAEVSEAQIAENKCRLHVEDSIREAYTATFMNEERAKPYGERAARLLIASEGNWQEVLQFIQNTPDSLRNDALLLLENVTAKDLRDTPAAYLTEALLTATPNNGSPLYGAYLLSPRIDAELIRPFRSLIRGSKELPTAADAARDPYTLARWCAEQITVADSLNPHRLAISPAGVWRTRYADSRSLNTFFVALCRAYGIPARIEMVTGATQYHIDGQWHTVTLGAAEPIKSAQGALQATYTPSQIVPNPIYYRHFTIARLNGGVAQLLNFEEGDATEAGAEATWKNTIAKPYQLDTGYYLLTSGSRMASGEVLAHLELFAIQPNTTTQTELVMRRAQSEIAVIGNINAEQFYTPIGETTPRSLLSTTGRGYFIIVVAGAKDEPTTHATRALLSMSNTLNKWGRKTVVLFTDEREAALFDRARLEGIEGVAYGIDRNGAVRTMLCQGCNAEPKSLPAVAVADSFGRVVYFSQGYNTALSEQLNELITKL